MTLFAALPASGSHSLVVIDQSSASPWFVIGTAGVWLAVMAILMGLAFFKRTNGKRLSAYRRKR